MSNISNIHTILPLTKTSAPLMGQRLIRLIAKADRNGKYPSSNLTDSLCVSVPRISQEEIVEVIDRLLPHIIGMCESVQDKIAREYRIESGRDELPQSQISMDAILGYMDASMAGDRVSKEYLAEWFSTSYSNIAAQWITQVSNGTMSDDIIDAKCGVLRDMFAGYASPKYSPNIPSLKAIIRFATHTQDIGCADSRMDSIRDKAHTQLIKKENELSTDALGF